MGTTRPTAARASGVTERLQRLDQRAFAEFCAALWRARGYETTCDGDRVVAQRPGERLTILPRAVPGRVTRLVDTVRDRVRGPSSSLALEHEVDVVVTPVDTPWATRLAERHDARLVGPTTLTNLLLYGVARTDADALTSDYLGDPTATLLVSEEPRRSNQSERRATPTAVVAVVGVICLVLAAGVAGVWAPTGPEPTDDTAPPLLTGAGVEPGSAAEPSATPETDASRERYPPGVGEGYLDAWVLSRAHASAVSGRSYRLVVRQSETDSLDGDRRWDGVWQHAVVENERTWLYSVVGYETRENDSALVQYTLYTDGESIYRRADLRDGSTYDRSPFRITDDDGFGMHTDRTRRYVLRYLTTTSVEVDRVSWRPDEYRIVATGQPAYVTGSVSNYTATAFVDESGFVSELTVEFTREENETGEPVRFRFEYAAVDETVVRPPGWYDEARAATATNTTATSTAATNTTRT